MPASSRVSILLKRRRRRRRRRSENEKVKIFSSGKNDIQQAAGRSLSLSLSIPPLPLGRFCSSVPPPPPPLSRVNQTCSICDRFHVGEGIGGRSILQARAISRRIDPRYPFFSLAAATRRPCPANVSARITRPGRRREISGKAAVLLPRRINLRHFRPLLPLGRLRLSRVLIAYLRPDVVLHSRSEIGLVGQASHGVHKGVIINYGDLTKAEIVCLLITDTRAFNTREKNKEERETEFILYVNIDFIFSSKFSRFVMIISNETFTDVNCSTKLSLNWELLNRLRE